MRIEMPHPLAAGGTVALIGNPIHSSAACRGLRARRRRCSASIPTRFCEELLGLDAAERGRLRSCRQ